jgi:hypothetical protein
MSEIFISGSMRIKKLDPKVQDRVNNIIRSDFSVLIGDADGVDASIQEFLNSKGYKKVTIYCSGNNARNNIGRWAVEKIQTEHQKNSRLFFTAKDLQMAKKCDYGFMVWDSKSTGTLSNVYELLSQGKKSLVFINKIKTFRVIGKGADFENLVALMDTNAFNKADKKIQLVKKIQQLKQSNLFNNNCINAPHVIEAGI